MADNFVTLPWTFGDRDMNSDTQPFDLSQFGAWYVLAGIEVYAETADSEYSCQTLLLELARVEAWEQAHGDWYDSDRYAELRERIEGRWDDLIAWTAQCDADERRERFTVIDGGKKNSESEKLSTSATV